MRPEPKLSVSERQITDAFLQLLTDSELAVLRDCAFPQVTGRPASRFRAAIEDELAKRSRLTDEDLNQAAFRVAREATRTGEGR